MCRLLGVGRDGYHRWSTAALRTKFSLAQDLAQGPAADHEVRDMIQVIALEMSSYGYRTINRELGRIGLIVHHERVLRLMHLDNLLCLRRGKFRVTSNSIHACAVYPNLVPALDIDGLNQLWVAVITYIRLRR